MIKSIGIEEVNLDGFQIVRSEMFLHSPRKGDATCTVWPTKISFSKLALTSLNSCEYVRIEINPSTKCLLVVPVTSKDKDSIRWIKGQREFSVRNMESKQFGDILYSAWGLNPECNYRATGRLISSKGKVMLLFDFTDAEMWKGTVVDFQFGVPTIESFIKNGQILLEDNGIKTSIAEKGTGMQRALALSLIQVYSQIANSGDAGSKPIFFFIDEPETFLHPMAQDRLLEAFNTLSEQSQIFVTTHSPYLLRSFDSAKNSLRIFSRDSGNPRIKEITDLNLFPYSPSWGEINYAAFGVVSEEFHNELFSLLHNKARETNQHYDNHNKTVGRSLTSLDDWLNEQPNISKTVVGKHDNFNPKSNNRRDLTMPVYIRNYIDHPGDAPNPQNMRSKPSKAEITNSIQSMLTLIKNIS